MSTTVRQWNAGTVDDYGDDYGPREEEDQLSPVIVDVIVDRKDRKPRRTGDE
ncbi:MAG: hypothetical protein JW951_02065 [Lentisphaerae bacterium]|nr:hypothetical protein [Lentisphaerota bacterium]